MKKVLVILGPTGVGKTDLSIKIAKKFNGEIISGDSVQVFRELNIGSAKIKEEEKQGVKHHLLDILDVGSEYSVCDFQKNVRDKISEIEFPIICGGTGLYIDAAIRNYEFSGDKRDETFEDQYKDFSNDELYSLLISLDPKAQTIHMNNRKRVLRALYVIKNEDKSIKDNNKGHELVYDCLILGLEMDRTILYDRINKRVDMMINEGLEAEVKSLYDNGHKVNVIGYKEFYPYFEGVSSCEDVINQIKQNSRHYAKRQFTWFRRNDDIVKIDMGSSDAINIAMEKIEKFYEEK